MLEIYLQTILHTNNILVYKIIYNLINIVNNYFLSLDLIVI